MYMTNDEGEKTIIYLKRNKNKEKEFVLMSQEKNEFTIIAIQFNEAGKTYYYVVLGCDAD